MEVFGKHEIKTRTQEIWYEGGKYHRRCDYHGRPIYIICFFGVSKCQIEFYDGRQEIVEVDDAQFELKEYQT